MGSQAISSIIMVVYVVCTQPQIHCTDATVELLDCSFGFHFLVSKDTTKLGLMLQAQIYEIFAREFYEYIKIDTSF